MVGWHEISYAILKNDSNEENWIQVVYVICVKIERLKAYLIKLPKWEILEYSINLIKWLSKELL